MRFTKSHMLGCLAAMALSVSAVPTVAQTTQPTAGTYMLEGGSYSISIEQKGSDLLVHEPNKDSTYEPQADGSFHVYNPATSTTYGIRVIDDRTIEAFKPGVEGNAPSRLKLISSAVPTGDAVSSEESERWVKLADTYMQRSQSDPDNLQSWVACGAVALKRSDGSREDADAYAAQMAGMLQQLDATSSPCPEVFTF